MEKIDQLRRRRGAMRGGFTKTLNQLDELTSITEIEDWNEINTLFSSIQLKWERLYAVEQEILEIVMESNIEEYEEEYGKMEEYEEKFIRIREKVKDLKNKKENDERSMSNNENKRHYKLPKIELKKFDGNVRSWIQFWSQFRKIHEDQSLAEEDKIQYLLQSTQPGSKARQIVESYPPSAENYKKAIEALRERFGREDMLIEVYIRELISTILKTSMKKESCSLALLYDNIETQLRSLESLGIEKDKFASVLYPMVESCLPEDILRLWERHTDINVKEETSDKVINKLNLLMKFIKREVESEQRLVFAKEKFGLEEKVKSTRSPFKRKTIPTATELLVKDEKEENKDTCLFCSKNHRSQDCKDTFNMPVQIKKNILAKNQRCFKCLRKNHKANQCWFKVFCYQCKSNHFKVLCPEAELKRKENYNEKREKRDEKENGQEERYNSLSNRACTSKVLLQTLPVMLINGKKKLRIKALLDSGSQQTYIGRKVVEQMGYKSKSEQEIVHHLFGNVQSRSRHRNYQIYVSDIFENYFCTFEAMDQEDICTVIPKLKRGKWYEEIEDMGVMIADYVEEHSQSEEKVQLLIGADILGKLLTGNVKQLKCGLTIVETLLGNTLMGKFKENVEVISENNVLSVLSLNAINSDIKDIWSVDSLGINDPIEIKNKYEIEKQTLVTYKEGFEQIKTVTGVADIAEAEQRFITQKAVRGNLLKLKKQCEKGYKDIKLDKEYLEMQMETMMGADLACPKSTFEETLEKHRQEHEEQVKRKEAAIFEFERITKTLAKAKTFLWQLCQLIQRYTGEKEDHNLPSQIPELSVKDLADLVFKKYGEVLKELQGQDTQSLKKRLKDEQPFLKKVDEKPTDLELRGKPKPQDEEESSSEDKEHWPHHDLLPDMKTVSEERKRTIIPCISVTYEIDHLFNRYSSYEKLINVTAWMRRFIYGVRKKEKKYGHIEIEERRDAEFFILKKVQENSFKKAKLGDLKSLKPIFDKFGLLRTDLKRRFRSEYLGYLKNYNQKLKNECDLKVGDLVLIGNENIKRQRWPLARILDIYPGKDKVTRLVKLKTASGEFLRPAQKLYLLEASKEHSEIWNEGVKKEDLKNEPMFKNDKQENEDVNKKGQLYQTKRGRVVRKPQYYGNLS